MEVPSISLKLGGLSITRTIWQKNLQNMKSEALPGTAASDQGAY
jgi:hypothetical protein